MAEVIEFPTADSPNPEEWGGCPTCHGYSGMVHVPGPDGIDHWATCDVHRTCWHVGTNLFSYAGKPADQEEWKRFLRKCRVVKPWYPPRA